MNPLRILSLAALWCMLTRELSVGNVLLGLVLSVALVGLCGGGWIGKRDADGRLRPRGGLVPWRRILLRPWQALELAFFFLWELTVSNVRIALLVLRPDLPLRPMIIAVPVETESEQELAIVSDLVTLTPGTLSLDVEDDGRTLLVHVLSADDPQSVRRQIEQGLVRRVRRLFA